MNYLKENSHTNESCFICSTDNDVVNLSKENSLFNVFILINKIQDIQNKIPLNICTACLEELRVVSKVIDDIKTNWENVFNIAYKRLCILCFNDDCLSQLSQNLIIVFQELTNIFHYEENQLFSCNKCLNKLEKISKFITMMKNIIFTNTFTIKQEVYVKEEDSSDDEFVETPTKVIKNEPNTFSFENIETNNNFTVKPETIIGAIEEIHLKHEDDQILSKLEVEEDIMQYDCTEIIKTECPFDNKSFKTTRAFASHMKQSFQCKSQKHTSNSWKSILNKISKPFKCQVCLKYFSTVQRKEQHIKNHFRKSFVICHFCGKLMLRKSEYFNHFRIHVTKKSPLRCKFCSRKFATKLIYLKHQYEHKKTTNRLKCRICFRAFSKKLLKAHNKRVKISCPHCLKKFCMKSQMEIHLRSHTGEKPFQCAVCAHNFSTKGNLIKHSRTHSGYKPHSCKKCLKTFSRSDNLAKHYRTIHQGITKGKQNKEGEEVQCNICFKKYPSKQSLSGHMRVHNKEKKFVCEVCSKSFLYKGLLNGHMKIHLGEKPFECSLCPKRFIKRNDLTRHTYTHTKEKNYKCEICYSKFSRKDVLRLHLRSHTGQRPYKCENCHTTFGQKSNLTHHLKRCSIKNDS